MCTELVVSASTRDHTTFTNTHSTVAHLIVNEVLFFYVHKKMHEPVSRPGMHKHVCIGG